MKSSRPIMFLGCVLLLSPVALAAEPTLMARVEGGLIYLDTGLAWNTGGASATFNPIANEYRAVWFDSRIAGQNDIYSQRVTATGSLVGTNVTIVSGTDSSTYTSVAFNPNTDQYFMSWKNQSGGPGSPGYNHTYGGLASATGGLVTGVIDVSNGGFEPTAVYNSVSDEFFVEARNFMGGGSDGIYGRRVSNTGAVVGSDLIISTTGSVSPAGQVAFNAAANQYLATWRNNTSSNLKGRLINGNGTYAGSEFQISSIYAESHLAPTAVLDPVNDRYLVVFSEFSAGGVYAQFVSSAGTLIGPLLTLVPGGPDRLNPAVAYDDVNQVFLVAWLNNTTDMITAQLLNDDGTLSGPEVAMDHAAAAPGPPRIVANTDDGGFLLVWVESDFVGSQRDIVAQRVTVVPEYLSTDERTIPASSGGQMTFALTAGSNQAARDYFLLAGVTGTSPGTPLPGGLVTLPLNWDVFTDLVIPLTNSPAFANFRGTLDGTGMGSAMLDTLGPLPSAAIGANLYFAYLVYRPFDFASNPVVIEIVP